MLKLLPFHSIVVDDLQQPAIYCAPKPPLTDGVRPFIEPSVNTAELVSPKLTPKALQIGKLDSANQVPFLSWS